MKTLAILTNGGDTCALNASIRSIRDNAYEAGYKKIYGIRRGYQGLIDGWIDDITGERIDPRIGGSCLGSLRLSPTDKCNEEEKKKTGQPYKINEKRCSEMAKCLSDYRIDVLIVIGGDGTLQSTKMFQDWVNQQRATTQFRPFEIIGFLKTIDNDIRTFTNFKGIQVSLCPGFPSAAKKIISCVEDIRVTTRTAERTFSIETMGRDAGWLAAAATFGGAEILLVPEHLEFYQESILKKKNLSKEEISNKVINDLVDEIVDYYEKNRNVLISVAEGFEPEVNIKEFVEFTKIIRNLYGDRKKVGATELITMLVSPILGYYFWCLSYICTQKYNTINLSDMIKRVIKLAQEQPVGKAYNKAMESHNHPLKNWDIEARLQKALGITDTKNFSIRASKTKSKSEQPDNKLSEKKKEYIHEEGFPRNLLAIPPYKFEIRPHRTDYLPRSGPPSSYDYKFATVLGQKVGKMLLDENREYGAVPALEQVVSYDKLKLETIKTVQIDEIKTLNFGSVDYFNPRTPLQVSERIIDFFRTIMSGPKDLEEAIIETKTLL